MVISVYKSCIGNISILITVWAIWYIGSYTITDFMQEVPDTVNYTAVYSPKYNATASTRTSATPNIMAYISTDAATTDGAHVNDFKVAYAPHSENKTKVPNKILLDKDRKDITYIQLTNSSQQTKICKSKLTWCLIDDNIPFDYNTENTTFETTMKENPELMYGGSWAPKDCLSEWRIAIIIPVCERENHLRIFIRNIVPFLMIQKKAFTIFAVEQIGDELFNKARVMNVGFVESQILGNYNCFIFHDVDMIPVNLCNVYQCSDLAVRHMGLSRNLTSPRMIYEFGIGGASAFNKKHFAQINGFTNQMFGWGQEDDDAYHRIRAEGIPLLRVSPEVGNYAHLPHKKMGPKFPKSYRGSSGANHYRYRKFDGLNSLYYNLHSIQQEPALTRIQISMPGPKTRKKAETLFKTKRLQYNKLLEENLNPEQWLHFHTVKTII